MKAVYTKYPYKPWIYKESVGTIHLFDYDVMAKDFSETNDEYVLANTPMCSEFSPTWANAVWSYYCYGAKVVLHFFTDEFDEYEKRNFTEMCPAGWQVKFNRFPKNRGWVDIQFVPRITTEVTKEVLFKLLMDVYDATPFERWACDKSTHFEIVNTGKYFNECDPECMVA